MTKDPLAEVAETCLLMRTRLLSRAVSGIYQAVLNPFGVNVAQFVLLMLIRESRGASRADIGRTLKHDRSTLTRNLHGLLSAGWVKECSPSAGGRARPLVLTCAGEDLLRSAAPAWRCAQRETVAALGRETASVVAAAADRLMIENPA